MTVSLEERARRLESQGVHLGCPARLFVEGGRRQLMLLLDEGLEPDSKVLDIGCGSLRAGYWLIHFLDPGRYFGIEPDPAMLAGGLNRILEPGLAAEKKPRFDGNAELDFSPFGEKFSFFLARSVWTHAPKSAILRMLDGFVEHAAPNAVFLASFLPASRLRRDDYLGEGWIFEKSAPPGVCGMLRHSFAWIASACSQRGLDVRKVADRTFAFGGQVWLRIRAR